MQDLPSDAAVQGAACRALWSLSVNDHNEHSIVDHGGIDLILRAMNSHIRVASVQEPACGVLKILTGSRSHQNRPLIGDAGGMLAIVAAMVNCESDESVQVQAYGSLMDISISVDNEERIMDAGGGRAVVCAMKNHPHNVKLIAHACGTIKNLAATSDQHRCELSKDGGIVAIVSAVLNNLSETKVAENACGALKNIACSRQQQVSIAASDGIVAIIKAMQYHSNDDS
ncbi:armadillo repeat containing 6 [Seminavis robusta]|uniref:Armadillo repeat containing 6 n=1 Tax=Seminavis robusta TaxID=568900 RepID=A0A9N8DW62_9STRA|nr:armadillo repeat containing 6 [Seminavis robusta]|eukprot:Sro320_g116400.1 armadillo repeat containing 6 (228) ;mRNA; f:6347-7030